MWCVTKHYEYLPYGEAYIQTQKNRQLIPDSNYFDGATFSFIFLILNWNQIQTFFLLILKN